MAQPSPSEDGLGVELEADPVYDSGAAGVPTRVANIPFVGEKMKTYSGVLVHMDYWLPLPEQWEVTQDALLEIEFSHSPVLIERLSSMTASINGNAINSIFLNVQNSRNAKVVWRVPPDYLEMGKMNQINVTAKMRSDLELCDDVHSPALWLTLHESSRLVVRYREKPVSLDLSRFPVSYLRPDIYYAGSKQEETHVVIVVPDNPTPEVLNGVGVVAARIGLGAHFPRGQIRVRAVGAITADVRAALAEHNLVVIGHTGLVEKLAAQGLDVADVFAAGGSGRGWLIEARNPWNSGRRVLVVTGGDDAALSKAVGQLSLPHLSEQWKPKNDEAPLRAMGFDSPPPLPTTPGEPPAGTATITLADLGASDMTEKGKFHHYVRVAFPNPYVGRIQSPAFIRLSLSYSELLLPQTSSLLVKINGEPIRSVRLSPRTAPKLEADVVIPEKFYGDRMLVVDLEFFLDIGDPDCHYNFPEMAWATVFNESFVAFPLSDSPTTSLRSYPWVAAKEPNLMGLVFVVPERPTDEDLSAVANIAAFLGKSVPRFRDDDGRPTSRWGVHPWVKRAGALSDADLAQRDLVIVGDYDLVRSNPQLAKLVPESLFAAAAPSAASNPRAYAGQQYRSKAGWIHLAQSSFNPARNVLFVSGASGAAAVAEASEYLWVQRKVDLLGGTSVLVGPNGSMQVLIPAPGEEPQAAPSGALVPRVPVAERVDPAGEMTIDVTGSKSSAETPTSGPAAAPTSRHQVAYLVFVVLGLLLVILVVVRIRDALRSDPAR